MYVRKRWNHVHLCPDDIGVRHITEKQPKSDRETTRYDIQRLRETNEDQTCQNLLGLALEIYQINNPNLSPWPRNNWLKQ